jgi:O-antigen ligase
VNQKKSLFLRGAVAALLAVNLVKGGEAEYLLSMSEFVVIGAVAVWLLWTVASGEIRFKSSAATLPAFLMVGAFFISSLLSPNSASSFKGLHEMISYIVLFFLCLNLGSPRDRIVFGYMFIGTALVQAVVAVSQAAAGTERVAGTLVYPTYLVDTLIVGLSMLGGFLFYSSGKRSASLVLAWFIFLFVFVALFLTGARAGLPVLASSFIVLGVMKSKKVLLVLVVVVLAAALIPNPIRDRIMDAGRQDIYAMKRPSIWRQAVEITRLKPSSGVGMRNYIYYSRRTNFPVEGTVGRYAKVAKIAHNEYLQYAATTGLPGVATFLLFIGAFLAGGLRSMKSRDAVSVGSLAACTALLVHALVDNCLYLPLNGYLFFAVAGLLCSTSESKRSFRPPAVSHWFYARGIEKASENDTMGAIRSCRVALAVSPGEAAYHNALAKLYARRYDQTHGIGYMFISHKRYESAVRSNPLDRVFWEDFADFLYEHRSDIGKEQAYKDVERLLCEAIKVDPYNPFLRRKLAVVYAEAGSYGRAVKELKDVISLEPNFHSARFALAQIYSDLGMGDRAEEQYSVLRAKRLERLELRVQNEYEKRLIDFDWSILPQT